MNVTITPNHNNNRFFKLPSPVGIPVSRLLWYTTAKDGRRYIILDDSPKSERRTYNTMSGGGDICDTCPDKRRKRSPFQWLNEEAFIADTVVDPWGPVAKKETPPLLDIIDTNEPFLIWFLTDHEDDASCATIGSSSSSFDSQDTALSTQSKRQKSTELPAIPLLPWDVDPVWKSKS
mmetsp:Transcript_2127/g.4471  ORF Transcript_2127/g.4471 Transcript_2127/m.4471 type:complete len:177 (-) Transcript_2127:145-675(-)